jgi:hypothetical protein
MGMFYQNALRTRQSIEQTGYAEVLALRELPSLLDQWVIDIRWRDTGEEVVIDHGVLWDDLVWRKYPPAVEIVIKMEQGHAKVCQRRDGAVFIPALNWQELESYARAVVNVTSIAPKSEHGVTFWLAPEPMAEQAIFPRWVMREQAQ